MSATRWRFIRLCFCRAMITCYRGCCFVKAPAASKRQVKSSIACIPKSFIGRLLTCTASKRSNNHHNPLAASFVDRRLSPVDDGDGQTALTCGNCRRQARRTAADDKDIRRKHGLTPLLPLDQQHLGAKTRS
jgi:hypothetical protein